MKVDANVTHNQCSNLCSYIDAVCSQQQPVFRNKNNFRGRTEVELMVGAAGFRSDGPFCKYPTKEGKSRN